MPDLDAQTSLLWYILCVVHLSFSAVGNREQEKLKIPRKSFSILPTLPHLSSPRKTRSVRTFFHFFHSPLPDSLLMVNLKVLKDLDGTPPPPPFLFSPCSSTDISVVPSLWSSLVTTVHSSSGLDVPASPLGVKVRHTWMCLLAHVFFISGLFRKKLLNHYFMVHQATAGFLCRYVMFLLKLVSNVLNSVLFHLFHRAMQFYHMWVHLSGSIRMVADSLCTSLLTGNVVLSLSGF